MLFATHEAAVAEFVRRHGRTYRIMKSWLAERKACPPPACIEAGCHSLARRLKPLQRILQMRLSKEATSAS
jgi:hypothetical protein